MPIVLLLIVVATVYQLFFRYENYSSDENPNVRYEHDNLTGETHEVEPGVRMNVFARILGKGGSGNWDNEKEGDGQFLEPIDESRPSEEGTAGKQIGPSKPDETAQSEQVDLYDHQEVAKVARPVPIPREVVIASSAPPVPMSYDASEDEDWSKPFAVRQVDLNRDGNVEEIIQNATDPDGLVDISIVKNGREIFYGRGQHIALLPTRSQGWADVALKMGTQTLQVFRYNAEEAAYKALNQQKASR